MYMKRLAFVLLLLVSLLSSCGTPFTPYELDIETFESFYDVDYRITEDAMPKLIVELTPKSKLQDVDMLINLTIYISFYYDEIRYFDALSIEIPIDVDQTTYEKVMPYHDRVVIRGYTIDQVSGTIKAPNNIDIQTKTYDNTFEINHQIEDGSLYDNIILFNELVSVLNGYQPLYQNMYHTTSTVEQIMTIDGESFSESFVSEIITIKDPFFYQEISDLGFGMEISQDGDNYYMYTWEEESHALTKSIVDYEILDEIDVRSFKNIAFAEEGLELEGLTPIFTKVAKIDDTYHLSLRFMDFVENEPMLKELFDELKDVSDIDFNQLVIEMSITFYEKKIESQVSFTMELYDDFFMTTVISDVDNFEVFEPPYVRNNKKDYVLLYPSTFDGVREETDFSVTYEQGDSSATHMYYGYIEKGIYEFECSNPYIAYTLYNDLYHFVEIEENPQLLNSNLFEIHDSGYYYLKLEHNDRSNYNFKLSKKDLVDYIYPQIDIVHGMTENIHVESSIDLIKLAFETDQKVLVHFDFDITDEIKIYEGFDRNQVKVTTVSNQYSYGAVEGNNILYIKANQEVLGSVTFDVVELPDIYSNHIDSMTVIDTTFLAEDFYYGRGLGDAFFKFNVVDPLGDLYKFHLLNGHAQIHKVFGDFLSNPEDIENQTEIYLSHGTYMIRFNDVDLSINNIKYEIMEIINLENQITLSRVDYLSFDYNLIDVYETNNLYPKQTVSYEFTIDQAETLYVQPNNARLYNSEGLFLHPFPEDSHYFDHDTYIYELEAGTYKVVHNSNSNFLAIAIIDNLPIDDNPFLYPIEIINTGNVQLYKDHEFDVEFIKYTVTDAGDYSFISNYNTYLYHESYGYLYQLNKYYTYELEVGNYYIYTSGYDKQIGDLYTLDVIKVNN
ncbi:MAG: hypothetical protein NUK62_01615 [Tenericutes bacterium]|nr:hypothetical protein [Mycoplasmatota bacterium]